MSGTFAGERAVVLGLGVSGSAAARVLADEGADVRVSEARPDPDVPSELRVLGVEVLAGGHDPSHLNGATVVIASPGVTPRSPVLDWARDRNIPVWGELELGARVQKPETEGLCSVTRLDSPRHFAAYLNNLFE